MGHDKEVSARGPFGDERTGTHRKRLPLISQHHDIAECRLGFDHSEIEKFSGIDASAPRRTQDFLERNPLRLEAHADLCRIRPPLFAEIALRGAIIDAEAWRIPNTPRRIGMAHQRGVPACPCDLPLAPSYRK